MSIEEMRAEIKKPYPGWEATVDRMPPNQVYAIYKKFKEKGMLTKKALKKRLGKLPDNEKYHQMTIWDYYPETDVRR